MQDDSQLGSLTVFRDRVAAMPGPDEAAAERARAHDAHLTKPAGALGRLESLAQWAAAWQGRHPPRAERIQVLVFAGNHGVAARGVSAYPAAVTAQMVANFEAGGAAINQLCDVLGAELTVVPLDLERPTEDMTQAPALGEADCVTALEAGMAAVDEGADLLCLGEMGIGNTTAAAALAAALCGGDGATWVGPGTGVDAEGLARKAAVVDAALARHVDLGLRLGERAGTIRLPRSACVTAAGSWRRSRAPSSKRGRAVCPCCSTALPAPPPRPSWRGCARAASTTPRSLTARRSPATDGCWRRWHSNRCSTSARAPRRGLGRGPCCRPRAHGDCRSQRHGDLRLSRGQRPGRL